MNSRLGIAGIVLLAAFGLAACGGGGSGSGDTGMMPDPPAPVGPTAESIKADAADAITDAIAAYMAADQASKDAIKYAGMLTTRAVDGESAMAAANAQKVLNAEMAANEAVEDADDALQDAMAAKTAAEALADDDPDRASAIAAAEEAIKQATAQKKMAMDLVDLAEDTDTAGIQSLKGAVVAVKGSNTLADGYPKMPAGHGEDVAANVMTALATAVGPVVTDAPKGAIMHNGADIGAMTWAMIVGEANVMDVRRFDTDAISEVKAMSVMGSMASGLAAADDTVLPVDSDPDKAGTQNADGDNYDAKYKGIDGTVFCGGTDCGQDAGGNLTGSWYFTPDSPTELFVPAKAGGYMIATMYARYGAWLTYANADATSATGVSRYAAVGHSTTNVASLELGQEGTGDAAKDVTARFSGKAAGISVHNKTSGRFTADVNLTAKFAETPTLRGRVTNFQGNAVGNWTAILNETDLEAAANFANPGSTAGGGEEGTWTAQGYGPAPVNHDGDDGTTPLVDQRPEGFFGTFNANFGDGMAVGGYATRKAE